MDCEAANNNRAYCRTYRQKVKGDPVRLARKRQYDALASKEHRLRKKQRRAADAALTTEQFIARLAAEMQAPFQHKPVDLQAVLDGVVHSGD